MTGVVTVWIWNIFRIWDFHTNRLFPHTRRMWNMMICAVSKSREASVYQRSVCFCSGLISCCCVFFPGFTGLWRRPGGEFRNGAGCRRCERCWEQHQHCQVSLKSRTLWDSYGFEMSRTVWSNSRFHPVKAHVLALRMILFKSFKNKIKRLKERSFFLQRKDIWPFCHCVWSCVLHNVEAGWFLWHSFSNLYHLVYWLTIF